MRRFSFSSFTSFVKEDKRINTDFHPSGRQVFPDQQRGDLELVTVMPRCSVLPPSWLPSWRLTSERDDGSQRRILAQTPANQNDPDLNLSARVLHVRDIQHLSLVSWLQLRMWVQQNPGSAAVLQTLR